ncbi:trans-sulfuration enzyme family protein [Aestuariivirga sp.]|uniref:trans-sulfuration enzyme family protein n=1 Tax=Aestuariivirga sp. TaxID=2650926 RepID=UPI003BA8997D
MSDTTDCVLTPRVPLEGFDPLGIATYRASTITFKDATAYAARGDRGDRGYSYGLYGTPTTRALEDKLSRLEQASRTFLAPSGQAANALAILPLVAKGDHVLLADTVYPPMRDFAQTDLVRLGVTVEFFDPTSSDDIRNRLTPMTRIIWCESPGSTTMEVMNLREVGGIAHSAGALLGVDNTWATPLNLKPLSLGADIVTEALTKYVSGHSDVIMGSISVCDAGIASSIKRFIGRMGIGVSSDDATLVLRGSETLALRLRHQADVGLRLAQRLATHPLVARVLHPALPEDPGHPLFRQDFLGASGVFSLTFAPNIVPFVAPALDCLQLFAIGASWGGTRSLVAPMTVRASRTATVWPGADLVLRLSIGIEDETELWEDLSRFLNTLQELSRTA